MSIDTHGPVLRSTEPSASSAPTYGYCPSCGSAGVQRERRVAGNDTCQRGHVYPSASALPRYMSPSLAAARSVGRELRRIAATLLAEDRIDAASVREMEQVVVVQLSRFVGERVVSAHRQISLTQQECAVWAGMVRADIDDAMRQLDHAVLSSNERAG